MTTLQEPEGLLLPAHFFSLAGYEIQFYTQHLFCWHSCPYRLVSLEFPTGTSIFKKPKHAGKIRWKRTEFPYNEERVNTSKKQPNSYLFVI